MSFCKQNWHFRMAFEWFLHGMVKEGEITKEFNQLNKKTASQIEKFVKEKVSSHISYLKNEEGLQISIREYDREFKQYAKSVLVRNEKLRGFFNSFDPQIEVEPEVSAC